MGRLHKLGTFLIIGVIALSACAFIAVPTPKKTAASSSSSKRALLANAPVDQTMINNFGPMSMYYSYGPTPGGLQLNGPFTAMIDSPQGMTSANLAAAKASSDTFLSFNEPDGGTQVLSVSDALSYWPTLENLGMRLGAPALSHYAGASKAWLDSFMSQAVSAGYRVDFIPIHFYGENVGMGSDPQGAAAEFIRQLNELHNNWGRPIWVTEFALGMTTGSPALNLQFMQIVLPQLEQMPFVEKYMWWPTTYTFCQSSGGTGCLTYQDGSLTTLGLCYRDGFCSSSSSPPPSPQPAPAPSSSCTNLWDSTKAVTASFGASFNLFSPLSTQSLSDEKAGSRLFTANSASR